MAKFTKSELSNLQKRNEKIVALYKEGMSGTAIAKEVGLSSPMVYMIIQKAGASKNEPAKKRPGRPAKVAPKIRKIKAADPGPDKSADSDADKRAMDKLVAALSKFLKERNFTFPELTKKRRGRPPKGK